MTLPPAFSLLQSEFNDFLYASIGDERNHAALTVLSAFTRQDIDPWRQAEALSRQSRDRAARSLADTIMAIQDGAWTDAEALAIAVDLVALLPRRPPANSRWRQNAGRLHAMVFRVVSRFVRFVAA